MITLHEGLDLVSHLLKTFHGDQGVLLEKAFRQVLIIDAFFLSSEACLPPSPGSLLGKRHSHSGIRFFNNCRKLNKSAGDIG